jgi:hypothetical protein
MKKSKKQLAKMAQSVANKLKNFHEDSFENQKANKLVDYNTIANTVRHLEEISNLLSVS